VYDRLQADEYEKLIKNVEIQSRKLQQQQKQAHKFQVSARKYFAQANLLADDYKTLLKEITVKDDSPLKKKVEELRLQFDRQKLRMEKYNIMGNNPLQQPAIVQAPPPLAHHQPAIVQAPPAEPPYIFEAFDSRAAPAVVPLVAPIVSQQSAFTLFDNALSSYTSPIHFLAETCSFLEKTERANVDRFVDSWIVDSSFVDGNSGMTRTTTDFYNLLTDDPTPVNATLNHALSTLSLSVKDVGTVNAPIDG
jgi:hypothetical protein